MAERMKAAVLKAPYKISIEQVKKPKLNQCEVLIETKATGICGTDVEIYKGKTSARLPLIMGHETTGRISEIAEGVENVQVGSKVLVNPILSCGRCVFCMSGRRNLCERGGLLGREKSGSYAEYLTVPEANVFELPDQVSYEEGTVVELLLTVYHGQSRVRIMPGCSVAVLGQGPAGLLHTRLAKLAGANPVLAISRSEWKLELARSYGADIVINARSKDPVSGIKDHTNGRGADVVIETAGVPETIQQSIQAVRSGGDVLQFGICAGPINRLNLFDLYFKEIRIIGSRGLTGEEFHHCVRLVASGAIDVKQLITHEFPLDKLKEALDLLHKSQGSTLRVIIK